MDFQFDPKNFVGGLLAGWVSAFVFIQAREVVRGMREANAERANKVQAYTGAEARYVSELTKFIEANHIAGTTVELSKILVEPRFIPNSRLAMPAEEDPSRDPFRVVPLIHDHPALHTPYNIDTASIKELGAGDRAIALLGMPGSGRTTALQAVALWSLGVVDFKPPKDKVQIQLEAEEAALKADERANRIKEYLALEDRARERLAEEQGEEYNASAADARKSGLPLLRRLLPVYIHLANLHPHETGRRADPAEPLVRAVQSQVGSVTAKTLPRSLYDRLNRGGALVLLDGFDDLPPAEQRLRLPWLRAFVREYRRNIIIIAGAPEGYGALSRAGFTPVFLRPWHDMHIEDAAEKWANHWSRITGARRRDNERPAERLVRMAKANSRRLTPLEMTLRLRSIYNEELQADTEDVPVPDAMQLYLRALGVAEGDLLTKAAKAAALQLDEGWITPARLNDIFAGSTSPAPAPAAAAPTDALDELDDEQEPAAAAPKATGKQANIPRETAQVLKTLESKGLLRHYRGEHYQFRYTPVAAYLASLTLPGVLAETLRAKAMIPSWELALAYAASHMEIDAAVQARLTAPPDVLRSHLLTVTRWLTYASGAVNWRNNLFKQLGNLLIAPNQYPLLRDRVAAALVGTGDKSALTIFQKALKHPDPQIRRLACLGTGAMQDSSAVDTMLTMTGDPDSDVQLAAALALAAIATDEALEAMALTLTDGNEQLQRAAAESFAAAPEEGYPVLYEAVTGENLGLRRAAVFGLRRIPAPWGLISIYRVFLEDPEWYVRSAAQQVFIDLQTIEHEHLRGYPPVEAISWLREWIEANRKEGETPIPDQELVALLQEGDPEMQAVSAQAIGQLGMVDKLDELYAALLEQNPQVRTAAYQALADLQQQMGEALPAPV